MKRYSEQSTPFKAQIAFSPSFKKLLSGDRLENRFRRKKPQQSEGIYREDDLLMIRRNGNSFYGMLYDYRKNINGLTVLMMESVAGNGAIPPAIYLPDLDFVSMRGRPGLLIDLGYLVDRETSAASAMEVITKGGYFSIDNDREMKPDPILFSRFFTQHDANRLIESLARIKEANAELENAPLVLHYVRYRKLVDLAHSLEPCDERKLMTSLVELQLKYILARKLFEIEDAASGRIASLETKSRSASAAMAAAFMLSHPYFAASELARESCIRGDCAEREYLADMEAATDESENLLTMKECMIPYALDNLTDAYGNREVARRLSLFNRGMEEIVADIFSR
jgi:hypothetical protein